jgi:ketosteroid isomerase-like protein
MDADPQQETSGVVSRIAALWQAWPDAVRASDAERLATMVSEDVVVVHCDGRCVRGREELKQDFVRGFEAFSIEQEGLNFQRRTRRVGLSRLPKSQAGSHQVAAARRRTSMFSFPSTSSPWADPEFHQLS